MDKLADMYYGDLEQAEIDFKEDTKKINQSQKIFQALVEAIDGELEMDDIPDQMKIALCSCCRAEAVRAYKMGIVMGQTIAGVKN